MKHRNTSIIDAIAQEETRVARLDDERAIILERIGGLRNQLQLPELDSPPPSELPVKEKMFTYQFYPHNMLK